MTRQDRTNSIVFTIRFDMQAAQHYGTEYPVPPAAQDCRPVEHVVMETYDMTDFPMSLDHV